MTTRIESSLILLLIRVWIIEDAKFILVSRIEPYQRALVATKRINHQTGKLDMQPEYVKLMRTNPMFMDLSENDFIQVLKKTILSSYKTGEVLFRQRDPAAEFFLLISGKVKLSLLSFEGNEKVVNIINEGQTFAEAIIFNGAPFFPVNAEVLSDILILRINAENYKAVLRHSPEACFKVMGCLSTRIHWLMNELDRLSLHNATYRLISYLLDSIPGDTPDPVTNPVEINLSIPKHVIASRLSITPETFSRTIRHLSKQGLLDIHDSHIVLKNPAELRLMISI